MPGGDAGEIRVPVIVPAALSKPGALHRQPGSARRRPRPLPARAGPAPWLALSVAAPAAGAGGGRGRAGRGHLVPHPAGGVDAVAVGLAVAGPFTGGQIWAQLPLQFDLVLVSGTNQYKVKPLALVSTVTPLIVVVFTAEPEEAGPEDVPLVPPEPGDEPPHPAASNAAAANTIAAGNPFRIDVSLHQDRPGYLAARGLSCIRW